MNYLKNILFDVILMKGDYMNLNDKELTDYILNLPKEKRIKLLQSDEIRNKYLELCNRYQFLSLIQKLDNDIKYFIDDE